MKIFYLFLLFILTLPTASHSQDAKRLADFLKRNPAADTNGDGVLTLEEARAHRRKDPSQGDNLKSTSRIRGIPISEEDSPIHEVPLRSPDGVDLSFAWRSPKGEGPWPVILFLHGGGSQSKLSMLQRSLRTDPVQTRFLDKGFLVVQATRRPFWEGRNSEKPTGFSDAVDDTVRIIEKVKTLPGVNPNQINLYGGSGGGILAIATAARTDVAHVVAGEPATVIAIDPKEGQQARPTDYQVIMDDPGKFYTPERKKAVREWMKNIKCPVLLLQGKPVGLYKTNFEILIPEMKELGKNISNKTYPEVTHGFYWGTAKTGATKDLVEQFTGDVEEFLSQ